MSPDQEKGQHGSCETVKVKAADGSAVVINASDFDAKVHEKFEEPKEQKAKK